MKVDYTDCPRCGTPIRMEGHKECNSNWPNLTWSGQCDECSYPDEDWREEDDNHQPV